MRQEEVVQGAFHMKAQNSRGGKDKKNNRWRNKKPEGSNKQQGETFPPCPHCKKTNHPEKNVGGGQMSSAESVAIWDM